MKKFQLDINLDDENEVENFINAHGTIKGRMLANRLGLKGVGSANLATALSNYAWNKKAAMAARIKPLAMQTAMDYENICDNIYSKNIQPFCDCW
jgi:Ran GTPase-activating protein (RanGAP) involved in mRNA processing and transport